MISPVRDVEGVYVVGFRKNSNTGTAADDISGMPNAGMGRIIRFAQAQPLQLIIGRIAGPLGSLTHCQSPDPPDR